MFSNSVPITLEDLDAFRDTHQMRVIDACYLFGLHPGHWRHRINSDGLEPVPDVTVAILVRILAQYPCLAQLCCVTRHTHIDTALNLLSTHNKEKMSDYSLAIFLGKEGSTVGRYRLGTTPTVPVQRMLDLIELVFTEQFNAGMTAIWGQSVTPNAFLQSWQSAANAEATARGFGSVEMVARARGWSVGALERLQLNKPSKSVNKRTLVKTANKRT